MRLGLFPELQAIIRQEVRDAESRFLHRADVERSLAQLAEARARIHADARENLQTLVIWFTTSLTGNLIAAGVVVSAALGGRTSASWRLPSGRCWGRLSVWVARSGADGSRAEPQMGRRDPKLHQRQPPIHRHRQHRRRNRPRQHQPRVRQRQPSDDRLPVPTRADERRQGRRPDADHRRGPHPREHGRRRTAGS